MHPTTHAIATFETTQDMVDAGYTVTLTEDEACHLSSVTREQREAALATFRGSPVLTKSYVPPRRARDSR